MKGKIVIDVNRMGAVGIDMAIRDVSLLDKIVIFDALAEAFKLDDLSRFLIAEVWGAGGIKAFKGVEHTGIEVSKEFLNKIKETLE